MPQQLEQLERRERLEPREHRERFEQNDDRTRERISAVDDILDNKFVTHRNIVLA